LAVDLKAEGGRAVVGRLASRADVVLEGFRPGVLERLMLGPDDLMPANPRLVYGRMTGWGQGVGPWSERAGHDINYIAAAGALGTIGNADGPPVIPLNLVGDYAGGALYLALGITSALVARSVTGRGQVVDAAISDGVGALMSVVHGLTALGRWQPARATNLLDGGAPFYRVYQCADGGYMAVGALEDEFYLELLAGLGLDRRDDLPVDRFDCRNWPQLTEAFAAAFLVQPRSHWEAAFNDRDACVTPVLSLEEASTHPQAVARGAYTHESGGAPYPAPAPRFSQTPTTSAPHTTPGETDVRALLGEVGLSSADIEQLLAAGVVSSAQW
jgi:alpha-methylacyl-CoA racemase